MVEAWNDAANRQDAERLTELSDPNIEILGPRGSGYGHVLLRDWLTRAGLSLKTVRAFAGGNLVVLAQHGVWRSMDSGEMTEERDLASHYRVAAGRVLRFARYDTLAEAFAATGLPRPTRSLFPRVIRGIGWSPPDNLPFDRHTLPCAHLCLLVSSPGFPPLFPQIPRD